MDHEADFCYSATASRNFPDYYDDEYGDAVETSLRELKDEFGETYKENLSQLLANEDPLDNIEVKKVEAQEEKKVEELKVPREKL